jgi:hypothetical protein
VPVSSPSSEVQAAPGSEAASRLASRSRRYLPLLHRVAGINALLLLVAVGVTIAILVPGRKSSYRLGEEGVVLLLALILVVLLNFLLLRRVVRPLQQLTTLARTVDLNDPRPRGPDGAQFRSGRAGADVQRDAGTAPSSSAPGRSSIAIRRTSSRPALAAGIWSVTFCVLGYVFWQSFDQAAEVAKQSSFVLVAVIATGVILALAYQRLRTREGREQLWRRVRRQRRPAPHA